MPIFVSHMLIFAISLIVLASVSVVVLQYVDKWVGIRHCDGCKKEIKDRSDRRG